MVLLWLLENHVFVFSVITQKMVTNVDGNQALWVLKYLNCLHERCVISFCHFPPRILCLTGPTQRWRPWRSRTPSPPPSAAWSAWLAAWCPQTTITQRAVGTCSHCSWALCREWTPTTSASAWWVMDVLISNEEGLLDKETIQLLLIKFPSRVLWSILLIIPESGMNISVWRTRNYWVSDLSFCLDCKMDWVFFSWCAHCLQTTLIHHARITE